MNKRHLSRRDFLKGTTAIGAAALLAACAPPPAPAPEEEAEEPAPEEEEEPEPEEEAPPEEVITVTVSVWGDVPDKNINDRAAAAFAETTDSIVVSPESFVGDYYDKVKVNFAGGTSTDLVYVEGYRWQPFVDHVLPLDDYIERDDVAAGWPDVELYENLTKWRGKTYVTVIDTGSIVMFYNKDLFDKAGVDYPTDDWTFDDFKEMVPKVTFEEDDTKYFGYAGWSPGGYYYVGWIPWIRMNGAQEFDTIVEPKTAMWTDPEIVDALQYFCYDQFAEGLAPTPAVLEGGGINFASGRVAMTMQGPWYLPQCAGPQALSEEGLNYDVVLPPSGSAGTFPDAEIQGHMIAAQSEHPEAAWEVLKFWMGEEVAKITAEEGRMCGTPANTDKYWVPIATDKFNFTNAAAFVDAQLNGYCVIVGGAGANFDAIKSAGAPLTVARDAMIALEKTAEEALAEANPGIQAMLDEYWADQ